MLHVLSKELQRRLVDLASTAILKARVGIAVKLAFHFAVRKHFLI